MLKEFFILLIFTFCVNFTFSQQTTVVETELEKQANKDWRNNNYKFAASEYEKLITINPNKLDYKYRFGVSNFQAGFDIAQTLKALEPLIGNKDVTTDVMYWLAQSYMFKYEFNDAIDMFNTYINSGETDDEIVANSHRFIKMCESAIELMNKPVSVSFENLGSNINSSSNDFNPFVPVNEEFIVYTSDKKFDKETKMFDQNIYISFPENNSWTFGSPLQYINTNDNEKTVGLSNDGKKLFVCGNFSNAYSEVDMALLKSKLFKFETVNDWFDPLGSKLTSGACISSDNNTIYLSQVKDDSKGHYDIYMYRKLPNGTWGPPKNLGSVINTSYDEICPNVSPDGKILYFASKGHNSMGGFDLFVSNLNEITGEWNPPINLGYPINTPGDDVTISIAGNRRYAYISSIRKEGYGGLDIYRATFKDIDEPLTVIKGKIVNSLDSLKKEWKNNNQMLNISIYDTKNNIFGKYIYNNNLDRFIAILPAGNYKLVVQVNGYDEYTEKISVLNRNLFQPEIEKTFSVVPKKQ